MPDSIADLLRRNLHEVFGEGDPVRRRAAIAELYTENAVFQAPDGVYSGRDAIDRVAGDVRATHPDYRYAEIAEPATLNGAAGRISWVSGPPGQAPVYAGTDFVVVEDGRIASLFLFFDPLPK
ncbi:nuclear transport factor 2 family protein [Sphingomonas sp. RB3P16]|uniref:nuclear transport factor 2 family protein n=1 Tax=Parasphingomonas frigoris TaxID=3096163 RepID=UPI002FCB7A37